MHLFNWLRKSKNFKIRFSKIRSQTLNFTRFLSAFNLIYKSWTGRIPNIHFATVNFTGIWRNLPKTLMAVTTFTLLFTSRQCNVADWFSVKEVMTSEFHMKNRYMIWLNWGNISWLDIVNIRLSFLFECLGNVIFWVSYYYNLK